MAHVLWPMIRSDNRQALTSPAVADGAWVSRRVES